MLLIGYVNCSKFDNVVQCIEERVALLVYFFERFIFLVSVVHTASTIASLNSHSACLKRIGALLGLQVANSFSLLLNLIKCLLVLTE